MSSRLETLEKMFFAEREARQKLEEQLARVDVERGAGRPGLSGGAVQPAAAETGTPALRR
jgi:hypothetical protein